MITITISVTEDGFFTNAKGEDGSFICTVAQPTLDLSLESVMVDVYRMAERELENIDNPEYHPEPVNIGLIVAMVICCVWVVWGAL